jgi:hypothetical protein
VPDSCAVVPAGVASDALASKGHEAAAVAVAALGVPTPSPMKMVAGGPAAVSVTFNVPPEPPTVNGWNADPPTSTVPENVSVVVIVGSVKPLEFELLSPLEHADKTTATSAQTAAVNRFFIASRSRRAFRHLKYEVIVRV